MLNFVPDADDPPPVEVMDFWWWFNRHCEHMARFARAFGFISLILAFTFLHASKGQAHETLIEMRAEELTNWIVAHSTYQYRPPPPIIYMTQATMTRLYGLDTVRAMYMPDLIILLDTFKLGRDDDILLHELVHHMQWQSGKLKYTLTECQLNHEREAYSLQGLWVQETGIGVVPDPMFVLSLHCGGPP